MLYIEIVACVVYGGSVFLAARNRIETWPLGIIGCLLYGILFWQAQLYADVTLQVFFIITSILGWFGWRTSSYTTVKLKKIRRTSLHQGLLFLLIAVVVALIYGALLHYFTQAYAPYIDSMIMAFSILAQLLLMARRFETWWAWLFVNTLSIPLYLSRELYLTAGLYTIFWFNAYYGLSQWSKALKSNTQ